MRWLELYSGAFLTVLLTERKKVVNYFGKKFHNRRSTES